MSHGKTEALISSTLFKGKGVDDKSFVPQHMNIVNAGLGCQYSMLVSELF